MIRPIKPGDAIERRYWDTQSGHTYWQRYEVTKIWRDAIYLGSIFVLMRDEGVTWRRTKETAK